MEPKIHGLGANIDVADNRNITIDQVVAAAHTPVTAHPSKNITDISMLPVEDQMEHGTCVGQAEGKGEEAREFKESGKLIRVSKRALYKKAKLVDGLNEEGTYPKVMAKILVDYGAPDASLIPDDNALPMVAYLNIQVETPEIKTNASPRRVKGYAYALTLDQAKTMVDTLGYFNMTVQVGDWETLPVKPTPNQGGHRILIYGYEDDLNDDGDQDTKIYFRNSWGEEWGIKGNGWFWWSQYEHYTFDMMGYTDMPDSLIDYAKSLPYQFTRALRIGMTGDDVLQLQTRLANETAKDGQPCYRYTENGKVYYGKYFGANTRDAVRRYQTVKGIVSSGTEDTTGFGLVGSKTRLALNGFGSSPGYVDEWAAAIQAFEGWKVGSRAYRNNNPGNIRYSGIYRSLAIGEDRGGVPFGQSGYCIFRTYQDGLNALTTLLQNAGTGKSTTYTPSMSLLEFYETYAPTSDNNYPTKYATYVAGRLGVPITTKISALV